MDSSTALGMTERRGNDHGITAESYTVFHKTKRGNHVEAIGCRVEFYMDYAANCASLTVRAMSSGTATITVTADDTAGNRVSDTFDVTAPKPGGL